MDKPNDWQNPIAVLQALYPGAFALAPEPPLPENKKEIPGGLLTTEEAAFYLSVSKETLLRLVRRRAIDVVKITPRDYRFRLSDLETFVGARLFKRRSALK